MIDNIEYIGLRPKPNPDEYLKYKDIDFFFDFHPKYYPRYKSVFVAISKTGKEIKPRPNEEWMAIIPHGRFCYVTTILELGDKGLLSGNAFSYYQQIKNQLEREVITEFKEHDLFCSTDDTIGVRVIKIHGGNVVYEKMKNTNGPFWQVPVMGRKSMPIHEFAAAVVRLNPQRYKHLIHTDLMVPK